MSVNYQVSTNPYTGKVNAEVSIYDSDMVESIVSNIHSSFNTWSQTPLESRMEKLILFKECLHKHNEELARIITSEIGCPISQTRAEVQKAQSIIDYYVANAPSFLAPHVVLEDDTTVNRIEYAPLGVHVHISPYNYPLYLALRPLIPSLIAGNTVLLKTPSNTPLLAQKLKSIIQEVGLEDICGVLLISGSKVSPVIEDSRIAIASIIGSETAGKSVASIAGEHIKKTILELGGSDPFVVFADADIDAAVKGATFSRLRNAGQSCNAAKRFIVHESIKDEFISKLTDSFNSMVVGDPFNDKTDFSPLANEKSLSTALKQIDDSIQMGARLVLGGAHLEDHGFMLAPTILDNVTPDMPVFKEETFSPIAPISSFSTTEEAISLANTTEFGLGASVWTHSDETQKKCISGIQAGSIFTNGVVRGNISMPYGGVKKSGYGREFSQIGLHELCNIKTVSQKKV